MNDNLAMFVNIFDKEIACVHNFRGSVSWLLAIKAD